MTTVVDAQGLSQCIRHTQQCSVLALGTEGVGLGRVGELTLIQLATCDQCFVLDMLCDIREEIISAIRPTLEDPDVTKVMHDCRSAADALQHLCGVVLRGVYDTQVWQCRGGNQEPSLTHTLQMHSLPVDRDGNICSRFPSYWATRPLTPKMLKRAAANVMPLLRLQKHQVVAITDPAQKRLCRAISEYRAAIGGASCTILSVKKMHVGRFLGRQLQSLRRFEQTHDARVLLMGGGAFLLYTACDASRNAAIADLNSKGWLHTPSGFYAACGAVGAIVPRATKSGALHLVNVIS